ncbi:mechanosensitive ion channel family protein [Salidesulfovibrio brasiliensis]|uniref:mechanosensitive ion channel family protein n=1 Tax=Salidesulfovibrio brasiliensis TaxID=221711 RepID=UPI0006D11178|nr:mechanosensitive ion channel family protein [Salidesulfovibrio brasiliensis]
MPEAAANEQNLEVVSDFSQWIVDVWHNGFEGLSAQDTLLALGIFLFFLIFRGPLSRLLLGRLEKAFARLFKADTQTVRTALAGPMALLPVILGFFIAFQTIEFGERAMFFLNKLTRTLLVIFIFSALSGLSSQFPNFLNRRGAQMSELVRAWGTKGLRIVIWIVGGSAVLQMWGIAVGPVIAGLGLFSVAVGLGAQDLFKNLIAGLTVVTERRYNIGDWVKVDGVVEGTVEQVGFRSTMVRQFDQSPIYVPNTYFSERPVTNFSKMTYRRIYWVIGVTYDTTVDQLREIRKGIEEYVHGTEDFASPSDASTFVRISEFSDSSIDIMLYCFTRTTNWGEWLKIKEELACRVKEIVEGAGSSFAFPSTSVYLETMPEGRPEPFSPPSGKASE